MQPLKYLKNQKNTERNSGSLLDWSRTFTGSTAFNFLHVSFKWILEKRPYWLFHCALSVEGNNTSGYFSYSCFYNLYSDCTQGKHFGNDQDLWCLFLRNGLLFKHCNLQCVFLFRNVSDYHSDLCKHDFWRQENFKKYFSHKCSSILPFFDGFLHKTTWSWSYAQKYFCTGFGIIACDKLHRLQCSREITGSSVPLYFHQLQKAEGPHWGIENWTHDPVVQQGGFRRLYECLLEKVYWWQLQAYCCDHGYWSF